ncbi:hypothetical protein LguiA_026749 [Lonicera macranthoides]
MESVSQTIPTRDDNCSGQSFYHPSSSRADSPKAWCVGRGDAYAAELKSSMDSVCSKLDCRDIKPGGSCFEPDILENHASYAIGLNYRFNGVCPSNIGTITLQEPSNISIFMVDGP